ncbi:MAG: hypothetical protein R3B99_16550 [Polyangiales bacterium]
MGYPERACGEVLREARSACRDVLELQEELGGGVAVRERELVVGPLLRLEEELDDLPLDDVVSAALGVVEEDREGDPTSARRMTTTELFGLRADVDLEPVSIVGAGAEEGGGVDVEVGVGDVLDGLDAGDGQHRVHRDLLGAGDRAGADELEAGGCSDFGLYAGTLAPGFADDQAGGQARGVEDERVGGEADHVAERDLDVVAEITVVVADDDAQVAGGVSELTEAFESLVVEGDLEVAGIVELAERDGAAVESTRRSGVEVEGLELLGVAGAKDKKSERGSHAGLTFEVAPVSNRRRLSCVGATRMAAETFPAGGTRDDLAHRVGWIVLRVGPHVDLCTEGVSTPLSRWR